MSANDNLGTIYVNLTAETGGFVSALSKAAAAAESSARQISREFASLGRVASQTFGAFGSFNPIVSKISFALQEAGSAASAVTKSFASLGGVIGPLAGLAAGGAVGMAALTASAVGVAVHATEGAAKLYELSQATGVSVEALSGLLFAAKQTGVETQAMTTGLERMSRSAYAAAVAPAGATNAFTRLGIAVKDSSGQMRDADAIFEDVAAHFAAMPGSVEKTNDAIQLFGRGGAALITLLNQGREGLERLLATADRLGLVISGHTAAAAEEFQAKLGQLSGTFEGLSNTMMTEMLPTLQATATWLSELGKSAQDVENAVPSDGFWSGAIQETVKGLALLEGVIVEVTGRAGQMVDAVLSVGTAGLWAWPAENMVALNKTIDANEQSIQKLFDSIDRANELETKQPQMAADILKFAGPTPDPRLGQFLRGLSGEQLQKIAADAMKAHENVAQFAADLMKLRSGGADTDPVEKHMKSAASAADKLAAAIASVTARANEEIATFGVGGEAAEMYRLRILGATEADLKQVEALLRKADAFKKIQPPTAASVAAAQTRGAAAGAAADDELSSINAAIAAAAPSALPDLSALQSQPKHPAQIALENVEKAGLRLESRGAGKFGFKGQDIESLQQMHDALASVGESTVLVDAAIQKAMTGAAQRFDEAALAAGTLREKMQAMFNEIQLAGQNFGGKVFETFTKGIEDASGQLAHFIVTGQSSFRQFFDGIAEELLKAQIQWSITKMLEHTLGGPGAPGANPAGAIGPGGTAGTFPGKLGIGGFPPGPLPGPWPARLG